MDQKKQVLKLVTNHYLTSNDFNGLPTWKICPLADLSSEELREILIALTKQGAVSLISDAVDVNPHIKRFPDLPQQKQLRLLKEMPRLDLLPPFERMMLEHIPHKDLPPQFKRLRLEEMPQVDDDASVTCVYPSISQLKDVVEDTDYKDRPFTLELARGAPQLSHRSFDSSVLEFYREDPRYYFFYDIRGKIIIKDEFYGSNRVPPFDEIVLENFGSSLDSEGNRAVAVFLRYLSQLTPEHQQIWKKNVLNGDYRLHHCYYKWMVAGEWFDCTSVFSAFSAQLECINQVCELMGRRDLFKNDFLDDARPREFGFLIRPTSKEFNNFVHLLDKMISENINLAFFQNEVDLDEEIRRRDGRVEVKRKGSINILAEWLHNNFHPKDAFEARIEAIFATFKKIRKMRQKPAHATGENIFDKAYFEQQIELMRETYEAISTLRNVFCLYPAAAKQNIPLGYGGRVVFR